MKTALLPPAALFLALCMLGNLQTVAATRTWSVPGGTWSNPDSWSPAGVPESGDSIVLGAHVDLGGATVVVDGSMTWTAGRISNGMLQLTSGAVLTLSGNDTKELQSVTVANEGTVVWQGTGGLSRYAEGWNQNSVIDNRGTFRIENDAGLGTNPADYSPVISINNAGTLVKVGGTGTTTLGGALVNTGLVDVQTGTIAAVSVDQKGQLKVWSGAALQLGSGSFRNGSQTDVATGAAVSLIGGTFVFEAGAGLSVASEGQWTYASGSFQFEPGFVTSGSMQHEFKGTLNLYGELNLPNCRIVTGAILMGSWTNKGTLTWTGGMLAHGTVTVTPGATLLISGDEAKRMQSMTLVNEGTVVWQGTGALERFAEGWNQTAVIDNRGTFRIENDVGLGTNPADYSPVISINNAGTLVKTGGTGTTMIAGPFTTSGTILLEQGVLSVGGSLSLGPNSLLEFVVAGSSPGSELPQLHVLGRLTLDGEWTVRGKDGYVPPVGTVLPILIAGSTVGAFINLSAVDPVIDRVFIAERRPNQVLVHVETLANPQPPVSVRLLGLTHGKAELLLRSESGADCELQATADFSQWITLVRTNLPTSTIRLQQDAPTPHQFYRALRR